MYDDGFINIINIDNCEEVIKQMSGLHPDKTTMQFRPMDCMQMTEFDDGSFDAAIDKGTLDSVLCGDNSTANASKMI